MYESVHLAAQNAVCITIGHNMASRLYVNMMHDAGYWIIRVELHAKPRREVNGQHVGISSLGSKFATYQSSFANDWDPFVFPTIFCWCIGRYAQFPREQSR